jgi:hypothetical protein
MADHELRIGADCHKCGRRNIEHANGQCPQPQVYVCRGLELDCGMCKRVFECMSGGFGCLVVGQCVNADRYEHLPPVRLWRVTP